MAQPQEAEERKNTLFCYTISTDLNKEVEGIAEQLDIPQSEFVRACLNEAVGTKKAVNGLVKELKSNGNRRIAGQPRKKLIYLSDREYSRLMELRDSSRTSMAKILRTGIELYKDKVQQKTKGKSPARSKGKSASGQGNAPKQSKGGNGSKAKTSGQAQKAKKPGPKKSNQKGSA
jgi:hypothetical protein